MRGIKFDLINVKHFCLRDPATLDWRKNKMLGIRLIQTTNEMFPLFQIFENELQNLGFPFFFLKCRYCRNMKTFEALQKKFTINLVVIV